MNMTTNDNITINNIAPLQNVSLVTAALDRALNRSMHLPGMVAFYGPSGFGKTCAATFAANKFRAYCIQAKSVWSRKAMLSAILKEMGITEDRTIAAMLEQICEQLAKSNRPLIIDEFDHVVARKMTELVRDIYDGSDAAILLIGEERIPTVLRRESERFHGRILDWVPAQPPSIDDAKQLKRLYCEVEVKDDLLNRIHSEAKGSARRIVVNLNKINGFALKKGIKKIGLAEWGERQLFTGEAPARRV